MAQTSKHGNLIRCAFYTRRQSLTFPALLNYVIAMVYSDVMGNPMPVSAQSAAALARSDRQNQDCGVDETAGGHEDTAGNEGTAGREDSGGSKDTEDEANGEGDEEEICDDGVNFDDKNVIA
ncbi:MAG: hypothetical protein M1821_008424 [Bathelium mastoideum]|nr:MAG: hypothetical protein M1821_008424 [Bathelium mastoideum]